MTKEAEPCWDDTLLVSVWRSSTVSLFLQVLMVRFASLFNVKEQTVTFISGATYSLEELRAMGMSELLGAMFDFSHKLAALELSAQELGLFTAVVLVSAGEDGGSGTTGVSVSGLVESPASLSYCCYVVDVSTTTTSVHRNS